MSYPEVPPEMMQQLMAGMRPDPRAEAAMEGFRMEATRQQVHERRMLLAWAGLFCKCPAFFDRDCDHIAPQQHCPIHSGLFWDPIAKEWI